MGFLALECLLSRIFSRISYWWLRVCYTSWWALPCRLWYTLVATSWNLYRNLARVLSAGGDGLSSAEKLWLWCLTPENGGCLQPCLHSPAQHLWFSEPSEDWTCHTDAMPLTKGSTVSSSGGDHHSLLVICSREGSTPISSTLEGRVWKNGGP